LSPAALVATAITLFVGVAITLAALVAAAIALFVGVAITLAAFTIALFVTRRHRCRCHRPFRRRRRRSPPTLSVVAIALAAIALFVARHPVAIARLIVVSL